MEKDGETPTLIESDGSISVPGAFLQPNIELSLLEDDAPDTDVLISGNVTTVNVPRKDLLQPLSPFGEVPSGLGSLSPTPADMPLLDFDFLDKTLSEKTDRTGFIKQEPLSLFDDSEKFVFIEESTRDRGTFGSWSDSFMDLTDLTSYCN